MANAGDPKNVLGNSTPRNALAEKNDDNLYSSMIDVIPASDKVWKPAYAPKCETYGTAAIEYRRRCAGLDGGKK